MAEQRRRGVFGTDVSDGRRLLRTIDREAIFGAQLEGEPDAVNRLRDPLETAAEQSPNAISLRKSLPDHSPTPPLEFS